MQYPSAAIKIAYEKTHSQLRKDLAREGIVSDMTGWSHDELVACWLQHFGQDFEFVEPSIDPRIFDAA